MRTTSLTWTPGVGFSPDASAAEDAGLALYFGPKALLEDPACYAALRAAFPQAMLLGCSSSGHLVREDIDDASVTIAAMRFDRTPLRAATVSVGGAERSREAGREIAAALDAPDLIAVFALSDPLNCNGGELLAGMTDGFGRDVPICGGMAGDGTDFARPLVGLNCAPQPGLAAAVGLYGDALTVGWGCAGGWNVFGPQRTVTRSQGGLVEELDGRPALDLYTRYLDAQDITALPSSALLFPILVRNPARREEAVVRTILGVDRGKGTLTFGGDVPRGWQAQMLRSSINSLTQGAEEAGAAAAAPLADVGEAGSDGIALLVSCVGRRLTMGQYTPYEIDAVQGRLPKGMKIAGFYSLGEFSPLANTRASALHNQTMTVMTLAEAAA